MTLYEIDRAILQCFDAETGEITDEGVEQLQALNMERENKIENIALWIKNLDAEAVALKAEADILSKRRKDTEANADRLRAVLANALQGDKFKTARVVISYRKSERVEVNDGDNEAFINWALTNERDDLLTYGKISPNLTAIKKAITDGAEGIPAEIATYSNMQIK